MNSSTPISPGAAAYSPSALPHGAPASARAVLQLLRRLKHGQLQVHLPGGVSQRFGDAAAPLVHIHLHNWNVCRAALQSGDIGFAESYIAGDWSAPDLSALLGLLIANRREI
mgnify:FL=1